LEPENIEKTPQIGSRVQESFICGIAKMNDIFLILLDMTRILAVVVSEAHSYI
jgi:chemotaxis signal transduction protein